MGIEDFEKLIKIFPEPSFIVSGKGNILSFNTAILRALHADRLHFENKTLFDIAATDAVKLQTYLDNCSRTRQMLVGSLELCVDGGLSRAFRCQGAVLEPATDDLEAIVFLRLYEKESASSTFRVLNDKIEALNREIAERRHAEEERERLYREAQNASRLKDEFLATISHELRTPLNAILGWTQMIRSGKLDAESFHKALETIERNVRSQTKLTEDLLDVSRIISGKLRLDVRPIDLSKAVAAAIESLRPTAENKSVRIQTIIDPRADIISGDAERIQQIMWNLLSNAIKFTPKNGRVQVRIERVNSHIEIVVSDTGDGISPEFLPYVFDRFRQSDGSNSRAHGGLGLGLAIVRHLTELHGGTVEVESQGLGKGSTFTIKLPMMIVREKSLTQEKANSRHHPTADGQLQPFDFPPKLKNLRVLVVDDEPDARELLRVILEQCEAEVTVAANAAEILELVDTIEVDIFISDIEMPHETGYSLIKKIRAHSNERLKKIPALALTAHARTEDRLRALSAGFDTHLTKPFEPAELVAIIERLARRSH